MSIVEATNTQFYQNSNDAGVKHQRLNDHINNYEGMMWWLPLNKSARNALNITAFNAFINSHHGRPYDTTQAIASAIDLKYNALFASAIHNNECFSKLFCSELAAAALEAGGVIKTINASEVTPADLCRFNIFADHYYQLKGKATTINGYNSINPNGFGEYSSPMAVNC